MSLIIPTKKINNAKIKIPKSHLEQPKRKRWKGHEIFDLRYWTMIALGKPRSGKTTLIYTLIKDFANRHTIVVFFCGTFWNDATYQDIREYLEEQDIPFKAYSGVVEENSDDNDLTDSNKVKALIQDLQIQGQQENDDKDDEKDEELPPDIEDVQGAKFDKTVKIKKKKKPKTPLIEFIVVMDDVSEEIRNKYVNALQKKYRHYRLKIILASHNTTDFSPHQWANVAYVALFRGFNEEEIEKIYERIQPKISREAFYILYEEITREGRDFLLIDRHKGEYRKNLDERLEIVDEA